MPPHNERGGALVIDFEHHWLAGDGQTKGKSASGRVVERYRKPDGSVGRRVYGVAGTARGHLEFMDAAGIDMAVLTTNPEWKLEDCTKWNDFCAAVVQQHPDRFAGYASIPPLGGQGALDELERAVQGLGLKGVHIWARSGEHSLDDRRYWPFYEKVAELKVPIDLHVEARPLGFDALKKADYPLYYVLAREFDICAATLRLCLGGVLEEFPNLVFVVNHFGGGVSAVLERFDAYLNYFGPSPQDFYPDKPLISKPWRHYFDKLYFNMAGRERGMDTVHCALTNISPKKLLFATDWPFNYGFKAETVAQYIADIRRLDLPQEDIAAMLGGNGAQLLGVAT